MKKLLSALLALIAAALIVTPAAFTAAAIAAEASPYMVDSNSLAPRGDNYVIDETGTLTDAQIESLNIKASSLMQKRDCAVYVWIVDLVPQQFAVSIDALEAYADAFYNTHTLGYGGGRNGMLLLLEVGDEPGYRDYLLQTHGACTSVFSNSVRERVLDENIVPLFKAAFSNGNFYKVADVFYDKVESEFASDFATKLGLKLAAVVLIPVFIALIVCSIWKRQMKTAVIARTADNYIPAGGFNLTGQTDLFLYRATTRRKIETKSSSSSGGSRSSSSGRSSGGRV